MILTTLLWGAAIIAGVGIIASFWNDLLNFLKKAAEKVQRLVAGVVYGCKVFIMKMREGVREISRHYSKVDQHWEETTVTKTISESEVPPEILARANANMELDIGLPGKEEPGNDVLGKLCSIHGLWRSCTTRELL